VNFTEIQNQILDLPNTFLREGAPFTQLVDAITAGLARSGISVDAVLTQTNFDNAAFGWLDFWGLLFGFPRLPNEPDSRYKNRITYGLTAGAGPPLAIQHWIELVWGLDCLVVENLPQVGYSIILSTPLTIAQVVQIWNSLVYIRPAGVPITGIFIPGPGGFLDTINFFNAPRVTGAYLGSQQNVWPLPGISSCTNNAQPNIPTLYLTDPTLNPDLVPSA
jgi:hypothetical protein